MKTLESDTNDLSPLCCCEYYDRTNQRFHILGCCCNCVALDEACDRFICCRRVPDNVKQEMLLTFQDRLRIPCHGGAKQISLDTIIPIFVIPLVLGLSALNIYCLIILTLTTLFCVGYFFIYARRINFRTRFFLVWILASVTYMLILFQFTVPLLEILPEENAVLFLFAFLTFFCIYKVKRKCRENSLLQPESGQSGADVGEASAVLIEKSEESDEGDYIGSRQINSCIVCQAATVRFDHHSFILDCCISKSNHKYYFFGLIFAILALLLGANLTLTSVCHPFLLFRVFGVHILLPDDCSEVFDQYEMGLSFILSVYSLIIAILATTELVVQIYSISKGLTLNEWKRNRRVANRKSLCTNWKNFLC